MNAEWNAETLTWLNPNGRIQFQVVRIGGFLSNVNRIQVRCDVNGGRQQQTIRRRVLFAVQRGQLA